MEYAKRVRAVCSAIPTALYGTGDLVAGDLVAGDLVAGERFRFILEVVN